MRTIDADRLKAVLEKNFGHTGGASMLEQLIDEQPTIEPSTNCSEFPNNSDTISRQQAIDALDCINGAEEVLRSLPSAQPNLQTTCNQLATDLISRSALCEYALNQKDKSVTPNDIMRFPSAQPEPKEGHWILYDKRFPWRTWYKCSECGNYLDFSGVNGGRAEPHFCPNCGTKMKGAQNG